MVVTHTLSQPSVATRAVLSGIFLVALRICAGLLVGLALVHLLGWLGLHLDSGTAGLLHRAFLS